MVKDVTFILFTNTVVCVMELFVSLVECAGQQVQTLISVTKSVLRKSFLYVIVPSFTIVLFQFHCIWDVVDIIHKSDIGKIYSIEYCISYNLLFVAQT